MPSSLIHIQQNQRRRAESDSVGSSITQIQSQ